MSDDERMTIDERYKYLHPMKKRYKEADKGTKGVRALDSTIIRSWREPLTSDNIGEYNNDSFEPAVHQPAGKMHTVSRVEFFPTKHILSSK